MGSPEHPETPQAPPAAETPTPPPPIPKDCLHLGSCCASQISQCDPKIPPVTPNLSV